MVEGVQQGPVLVGTFFMCCRCQLQRRATVFLPFLTHTRCPTVVNCRTNPDSSSFQIWQGL